MKLITLWLLVASTFSIYANSPLPNTRHISITGNASKSVKPDSALVHLLVENTNPKSIDAKGQVDKRINKFLSGLDKFNIKEEDVSASKIRTEAEYEYDKYNKKRLIGYRASRRLKVSLTDLEDLNSLLDYALKAEINSIENIQFKVINEKKIKEEVNSLAVIDAKNRARSLSIAFDAKLGKIYSINSSSNNYRDRFGMNDGFETITVTGSRLLESKEAGKYLQENIVFSASISVVFELEID